MKATTLAVTISVLASAGLAIVAAYDMTAWNRACVKEAGSPNGSGRFPRSMRDGDQVRMLGDRKRVKERQFVFAGSGAGTSEVCLQLFSQTS